MKVSRCLVAGAVLVVVVTGCARPGGPGAGSGATAPPAPSAPGSGIRVAAPSGPTPAPASARPSGGAAASGDSAPVAAQDCDYQARKPAVAPDPADPNRLAALAAVADAVRRVPVFPGARRVASAPVAALAQPPSVSGGSDQECAHLWLVAPGTVTAAMAWYSSHLKVSITMSSQGPGAGTTVALSDGDLWVWAAALGDRVGIAVFGSRAWLRTRPDWTRMGSSVTSVQVTTVRRSAPAGRLPPVDRTVTGSIAVQLAAVVDALPSYPDGIRFCPMDVGDADTLMFRRGDAVVATATVRLAGCRQVTLRIPGHAAVALDGASGLNARMVPLLGLPPAYLDR